MSKDARRLMGALVAAGCLTLPASAGAVNTQVADDFFFAGGGPTYTIETVKVEGTYDTPELGPVSGMNVYIYADSGTLPGALLFAQTGITPSNGLEGPDFTIPLTGAPALTDGTYWISVQAQLAGYPDKIWDWVNRTGTTLDPAAFQAPDGTIPACTSWAARHTCTGFAAAPDQAFSLEGTGGITPPALWGQSDMQAASGTFSQIDPPAPSPPVPSPAVAPPATETGERAAALKKCKKKKSKKKRKKCRKRAQLLPV